MKRLLLGLLLFTSVPLWAEDHEDESPQYYPIPGPMGPRGPQGFPGQPGWEGPQGPQGQTGAPGANGINGQNGRDGRDVSVDVHYTGRASVRVLDTKRWALGIYDTYNFRGGRNQELGVEATFKVGKSYEERRIERLEKVVREMYEVRFLEERHEAK